MPMQSPSQRSHDELTDHLRLVCAPMAGISTPIFRQLCEEKGASLTVTEMISARALAMANQKTIGLLRKGGGEKNVAAQIFGNRPHDLTAAAVQVEEAGFAAVDLNMGCPVRKVVSTGAGAALARTPALAAEIVAAIRERVSIPVTAKIRSGWTHEEINAPKLAALLEKAGLDAICVHARTRDQGYSGFADWQVIADVVSAVSIPVVGNGDVKCGPSALRMLHETGCRGVMVGRAALGNPWIFSEIASAINNASPFRPPDRLERFELFLRHLEGTIAQVGAAQGARLFRACAVWYTKGLKGAPAARQRIHRARSPDEIVEIVKKLHGL